MENVNTTSVLEQLNAHTPRKGSDDWHKLKSHLLVSAPPPLGEGSETLGYTLCYYDNYKVIGMPEFREKWDGGEEEYENVFASDNSYNALLCY